MQRYRDDDICQVYKIVGNGNAFVEVGWFDSDDPNNPAFIKVLSPFAGFGISATTVAAGISFEFNLEADRGKTQGKYHFDSEGPFLIVRRNSNLVVDSLDCVGTKIEVIQSQLDGGRYVLNEIPVQSNGIWDLATDPGVNYLKEFLISVARGSTITTTQAPSGPIVLETAEILAKLNSWNNISFIVGEAIQGQSSGAIGTVAGWSPNNRKVIINVTSGIFENDEDVFAPGSLALGRVGELDPYLDAGDEYRIINADNSTDTIEIQFEPAPISPRTVERVVPVRPGDSIHIIWDGTAWTLDGELAKSGNFLSVSPGTIDSVDINIAPGAVSTTGAITLDTTGPHRIGQRFTVIASGGVVTVGAINIADEKFADFVWTGSDWHEEEQP